MRQNVTVTSGLETSVANAVANWLAEQGYTSDVIPGPAEGDSVSVLCDPEIEFFRIDKMLHDLSEEFKGVAFETISSLSYEPDYIECRLCGERADPSGEVCITCGAPLHGDSEV